MKKALVEVELYEKGDKVVSPDGEGVVVKDEVFKTNQYKRFVLVRFSETTHRYTKNRNYKINPLSLTLIK